MYRILRGVARGLYIIRRWQVQGRNNIPVLGGAIVAANHSSAWDPILLASALEREIYYMGKEELFKNPVGNWFFTSLHAFPVKRGSVDRKAIRKAIEILESGNLLGIFPEGTRVESGQTVEPQAGVALLALKAKVPVIPVGLVGSRNGRPQAIIGQPLSFEEYYEMKTNSAILENISKRIMQEVNTLVDSLQTNGGQ